MKKKLQDLWASLPHYVQAGIVLFITTAGTTIAHSIEDGVVPHTLHDFEHILGTAVIAGAVAVKAFYMMPNGKAQLVDQAKAFNAAAAKAVETGTQNPQQPPQP